jgi:hypothetical protein
MDFSELRNNKEVLAYLRSRSGVYIIEARDSAHITTQRYRNDYDKYRLNRIGGHSPPSRGLRIYKIGAAGISGGNLAGRLGQYGSVASPNGFLVHYIGIAGGRQENHDLYQSYSHKTQVGTFERRALEALKSAGLIYRSLHARERTFAQLPQLIKIAKEAAQITRGRQFVAVNGMLVTTDGKGRYQDGVPITEVAALPPSQLKDDDAPEPIGFVRPQRKKTQQTSLPSTCDF